MRKSIIVLAMFVTCSVGALYGQKVAKEGMAWLAEHADPAGANVDGQYTSKQWGKVTLTQAEGSREVTGKGDGWKLDGVVSGKKLYLLFSARGTVNYCAELDIESASSLKGQYSTGMMKPKAKMRPMLMTK